MWKKPPLFAVVFRRFLGKCNSIIVFHTRIAFSVLLIPAATESVGLPWLTEELKLIHLKQSDLLLGQPLQTVAKQWTSEAIVMLIAYKRQQ